MTPAAEIARRLAEIAATLGPDELRVLLRVAERLHAGQQHYGRLNVVTDRRAWQVESLEEVADALIYTACAIERREAIRRRRWTCPRCDWGDSVSWRPGLWRCPRCMLIVER